MVATIGFLAVFGWVLSDRSPRSTVIVLAVGLAGGIGLTLGFRALLVDLP